MVKVNKTRSGHRLEQDMSTGRVKDVWPAVRDTRRLSVVRLTRLDQLRKMFIERKMSVQEIAKETGWRKDKIYHEMYYMKKKGMLPSDFKNPFSIWYRSPEELKKLVVEKDDG